MAAASMMILLFCGSEATAQSTFVNQSESTSLNVKQIVDLGSVELVSDAEALEIISAEYKALAELNVAGSDEAVNSIKVAFYKHMAAELIENKSIQNVLTDGQLELVKISNRFITNSNFSLNAIYNDAVVLVQD